MRPHRLLIPSASLLLTLPLLAACAGEGEDSGDGITVFAAATERSSMDAVIEAFEQAHDITVTASYADTVELQSTLRTQLSAGTGPDVFTVWPGNGNSAALQVLQPAGFLADLSDTEFAGRIAEGDRAVTDVDGATYLVPVTYAGIGVLYDTATLEEIGGEAPQTWNELIDLCGQARDNDKVLLSLGNQTDWVTQLVTYSLVASLVYSEDPTFDQDLANGQASFTDSGWRDAFEQYLEMDEQGCFTDSPLGTSFEASVSEVAQGEAVGVVQVTATLAQLREETGDAELGMFALPATDAPDQTLMPGAVGAAYGMGAEADNPEGARQFLEFLGSDEGQRTYADEGGSLPALPDVDFDADPALQTLVDYQADGRTVPFMDQLWPNPEVQQEHFTAVQQLFAGDTDIDQALARLDESYQED
ncbi:ABC transporter substrate-binding protein [Nocardiopsis valliformis]|uniref:ABC transporter substrate-binding protein n=1 Tax=Nocardiopsis valliformis TaxID=239974 RepID=UPI00034D8C42|nr:extracellular solute-binding protein [Nocardiopsis valliformis]